MSGVMWLHASHVHFFETVALDRAFEAGFEDEHRIMAHFLQTLADADQIHHRSDGTGLREHRNFFAHGVLVPLIRAAWPRNLEQPIMGHEPLRAPVSAPSGNPLSDKRGARG